MIRGSTPSGVSAAATQAWDRSFSRFDTASCECETRIAKTTVSPTTSPARFRICVLLAIFVVTSLSFVCVVVVTSAGPGRFPDFAEIRGDRSGVGETGLLVAAITQRFVPGRSAATERDPMAGLEFDPVAGCHRNVTGNPDRAVVDDADLGREIGLGVALVPVEPIGQRTRGALLDLVDDGKPCDAVLGVRDLLPDVCHPGSAETGVDTDAAIVPHGQSMAAELVGPIVVARIVGSVGPFEPGTGVGPVAKRLVAGMATAAQGVLLPVGQRLGRFPGQWLPVLGVNGRLPNDRGGRRRP